MRPAICLAMLAWASASVEAAAPSAAAGPIRDLRSRQACVREQAARRLGRLGDRAAVPALIEALGDAEASVRREAAKALGFLKDARAVAGLVKALGDPDTTVRFYAAYALGEIKAPQAAGPLVRALRDPQWCVRSQAAWALRETQRPGVLPQVASALRDEHADVGQIAWVLGHWRIGSAVEEVAGLLGAPRADVRRRAVAVLGELGGAKAVGSLVLALGDEDAAVRLAAVGALGRIGDRRALKPLAELARREKSASLRKAAEEAVRRLSRDERLLAHWSFDDRGTRTARDVTGRGNDGEIRGCRPAKGKVGWALRFGKDRYVELGRPAGLPIAHCPLTVTAWARSEAPNGVVVARGGAFCGFSLYLKDGVAKFGIHRMGDGPAYIAAGRERVVGAWVHLAGIVRDERIELYVNGRLAATAKTPGLIPGNCGQGMEIGCDLGNSPAEITDPFVGVIDEVKVYRGALSADEIARQHRPAEEK